MQNEQIGKVFLSKCTKFQKVDFNDICPRRYVLVKYAQGVKSREPAVSFHINGLNQNCLFSDINTGKTLPNNCQNLSTSLKCFA